LVLKVKFFQLEKLKEMEKKSTIKNVDWILVAIWSVKIFSHN
jgi:hypothetical protein